MAGPQCRGIPGRSWAQQRAALLTEFVVVPGRRQGGRQSPHPETGSWPPSSGPIGRGHGIDINIYGSLTICYTAVDIDKFEPWTNATTPIPPVQACPRQH